MFVSDIPTPALVIDAAALDRNIRRMAAFFAGGPCRLRPHFKAHKTPEIARRQLAAGSCAGLTCATVGEAEVVASLCDDILIANEVIGAAKCARVAATARALHDSRGGSAAVTVAVDSRTGLEQLAAAARAAGVVVGVLVDINVGQNRCGVASADEALDLARQATTFAGLALRGVMGYEGHAQPLRERQSREEAAGGAMRTLVAVAERLRSAGLPCEIVSAGGTGTFDLSGRVKGVTEIQAGSYALMDADYAGVGVPFEQAVWVLGTVVSRPAADRCVADCGHKSATKDHGMPVVHGIPGAAISALNDEHAVIALPIDSPVRVGDRVRLVPSHVDPTSNLHDVFFVIDGDLVVGTWPIEGRGYPEHRTAGTRR
ncbi:MAG TPA: DSD1 family PLP-dependent enzyme [Vicinamibacterales bacterium]|nr:DSD1 family PLP-dependent enzyme [Vicinamibacterales bacterium]